MGQNKKNIKLLLADYAGGSFLMVLTTGRMLILKNFSKIVFAFFISLAVITFFAVAETPEGKGKQGKEKAYKQKNDKSYDQGRDASGALISVNVRYEDVRPVAVANHYTGYKSLPPGIRKNLMRGKPLPPGIAKKMVPDPMLLKLPRYEGMNGAFAETT